MKRTWLMPLCVATLALGGCVVRQTATPTPAPAPAYIPPGAALGAPRLPPPVPLTPPSYLPPAAESAPPDTALTPAPSPQIAGPGGFANPPVSPVDTDIAPAATWEIAAPTTPDTPADTSRRLDEIRAKLGQDRAVAAPAMPSRFGGLSASGDVTPAGN